MNFIQLYHNARDTHWSKNVDIPVPNVLGLVLTHTQHWSSLLQLVFLESVRTPAASLSSISCNLVLRFNEILAFFLSELIFPRSLLSLSLFWGWMVSFSRDIHITNVKGWHLYFHPYDRKTQIWTVGITRIVDSHETN